MGCETMGGMTETATLTLTDFLLARIAEDERRCGDIHHVNCANARAPERACTCGNPGRVLAECEAKRKIVDQHKAWPVLVETPPTFEAVDPADPHSMTFRASQQIAWLTEQEYRLKFGTEPPTAPMIRTLAAAYASHPDYREEWCV